MPLISQDFVLRAKLPAGKREQYLRDTRLAGFLLRLRRNADGTLSKIFMIDWQDGKKRPRRAIGSAGAWHADKAREEAQRMLQAARAGEDPAAERVRNRSRPKFEDLVERFRSLRLAKRKLTTRKDYEGRIRRVLMLAFRGRYVADITTAMVADCHQKRAATPTEANRAVAVLSSMMKLAIAEQMRPDNPCRSVERNVEKPRDRWLSESELPRMIEALAAVHAPVGELLRFLAVTGWRVSEARLLTWDAVMFAADGCYAALADTKTGRQDRQLATDAAALIDRQPHRLGYVFSNSVGRQPIAYKAVLATLTDICKAAGVARITPHVLRHTAATHAALAGSEAHELRVAFGWKTLQMTAVYVSRAEALGRRGAERAAGRINIFQKPAADVVDIKR